MKKILFILPVPQKISPSARFRVELYQDFLTENGFICDNTFFWDAEISKILYKKGGVIRKTLGLLKGFLRRSKTLLYVHRYDFIFILRETTPIGPPVFEWLYAKLFRKKIIYDFDDAIWVNQAQGNNAWVKALKSFWKIRVICRLSYKVSVGNKYLYDYATRYNPDVIINPTCVDTVNWHNILKQQNTKKVVIGWTGSFSQLICLDEVIAVLQRLEEKHVFEFVVIADKNPRLPLKNYTFIKWNEPSEIEDLLKLNIGIMPLPDNEFTRGKCGFKLIQFMALGIPVAASPVEINAKIVDENENGFLCTSEEDWYNALEKLILNVHLREQMGIKGRAKIIDNYSVESNKLKVLSLFQ